jgi:hypothetical protein
MGRQFLLIAAFAMAAVLASEPPSDELGGGTSTPAEPIASASLGENAEVEQAPRDTFTGRPIDGTPRFEKQAAKGDRASMQWIVTKAMQRELSVLGYTRPEIDSIDAQRAVEVIKLKIRRPARGMPRRWRKDSAGLGAVLSSTRDLFARALGTAGPAVLLVALALAGVSVVATQGGGAGAGLTLGKLRGQKRSRASTSAFATQGDEYVAPPDRLWLDVQIDRFEWWLKNRNRRAKY